MSQYLPLSLATRPAATKLALSHLLYDCRQRHGHGHLWKVPRRVQGRSLHTAWLHDRRCRDLCRMGHRQVSERETQRECAPPIATGQAAGLTHPNSAINIIFRWLTAAVLAVFLPSLTPCVDSLARSQPQDGWLQLNPHPCDPRPGVRVHGRRAQQDWSPSFVLVQLAGLHSVDRARRWCGSQQHRRLWYGKCLFSHKTISFCQDRLGTSTGKAEKRGVLCSEHCQALQHLANVWRHSGLIHVDGR